MSELEKDLEAAARSWEGRILGFIGRFAVAFLAVIVTTMATGGAQWAAAGVWSAVIAAAATALSELAPSIPWQQVLQILDQHGVLPAQVDQPPRGTST